MSDIHCFCPLVLAILPLDMCLAKKVQGTFLPDSLIQQWSLKSTQRSDELVSASLRKSTFPPYPSVQVPCSYESHQWFLGSCIPLNLFDASNSTTAGVGISCQGIPTVIV